MVLQDVEAHEGTQAQLLAAEAERGVAFDGVGGLLPQGMDDVTKLPLIAQGLLDRGYSESDVKKVLGGNMLRVMGLAIDRR